ncbi:MAG: murein biosynthesis integral membrane protein MurJ [Gemmatimonadaceae bacterium]
MTGGGAVEQEQPESPPTPPPPSSGLGAALIAAGILLSRALAFVREALRARYLGAGAAADAFTAAFRLPNLLQNLFGEAALSASFIPVYARLLGKDEREAGKVAGAVAAVMALGTSIFVLVGILIAPVLVSVVNPGFSPEKKALTVHLARILFPGSGLFVLSAWCLGILNSHRRFFLSYAAPVAWNLALIAALLVFGPRHSDNRLVVMLAFASVVGALLQFAVQLPLVLRLVPHLRIAYDTASPHVRTVLRNFTPAFVSRGAGQLGAYIDQFLASFLPNGAPAMLGYAANLYLLPVSLFGMSVSAAELPEMARTRSETPEELATLRSRVSAAARRIAYFIVPSAVAFLALGDVLIAAVFQSGQFRRTETLFTWGILAGSAIGLLAGTLARLYSSTLYALHDTHTPLRYATTRFLVSAAVGAVLALPTPRWLGIDQRWGTAGLTAAGALGGWVEFMLLRRTIRRRIGGVGVPMRYGALLWGAAALAAASATAARVAVAGFGRFTAAVALAGAFGVVYLVATYAAGVPEAAAVVGRVRRRSRMRR